METTQSGFTGLYSIRRMSFAAYLIKRVTQDLLKHSIFRKMQTAGLAAIRDIPPPPAQPFISLVQDT
jgi:hypothetical protein